MKARADSVTVFVGRPTLCVLDLQRTNMCWQEDHSQVRVHHHFVEKHRTQPNIMNVKSNERRCPRRRQLRHHLCLPYYLIQTSPPLTCYVGQALCSWKYLWRLNLLQTIHCDAKILRIVLRNGCWQAYFSKQSWHLSSTTWLRWFVLESVNCYDYTNRCAVGHSNLYSIS